MRRLCVGDAHLQFNFAGKHHIVIVQKCDPFSLAGGYPRVTCRCRASVLGEFDVSQAIVQAAQRGTGRRVRPISNNHYLHSAPRLRQGT